MKKIIFLNLLVILIIGEINAQNLVLELEDCNSVRLIQNKENSELSGLLVLEKEIIKNVWTNISDKVLNKDFELFSNLKKGIYRVILISPSDEPVYSNSIEVGCKENIKPEEIFSVYPNPSSDIVKIKIHQFTDSLYEYNIYSLKGMLLKEGALLKNLSPVSIKDFKPGIYVISVLKDKRKLGFIKLIKQ